MGVFVGSPLPRRMRITEADIRICCQGDLAMFGQLGTLISSQCLAEMFGQGLESFNQFITDSDGPRSPGRWTRIVNLLCRSTSVAITERRLEPITRSPSQWPGTARSATSEGYPLFKVMSEILSARLPVDRLGTLAFAPAPGTSWPGGR